jgi:HPt (histidine-containing phosphotransfer) domain-containing protein
MDAGMNDFVSKPMEPEVLYRAMAKQLPRTVVQSADVRQVRVTPLMPAETAWQSLPSALRSNHWIDARQGLNSTGSDPDFYQAMLSKFALQHGETLARLVALREQDKASAIQLVHALKGTAATLGMAKVSRAAEKLEAHWLGHSQSTSLENDTAAKDDAPGWSDLRQSLSACLDEIRMTCTLAPPDQRSTNTSARLSHSQQAALRHLLHWLETDNTQSLDAVQEQALGLRSVFGAETDALLREIEDFDYPAAAGRVLGWLHKAG